MYTDLPSLLRERTARAWRPRARPPVDLWCDEHRSLPTSGVGANLGGRWNTDNTPYMRQILRATTDPEVREIAVQKSSQVGMTELLFCVCCYFTAVLGRSLLYVYPTKDKGVKVNQRRLVPALRLCGPTAAMLRMGGKKAATSSAVRLGTQLIWFAYTKSKDSMKGDPVGPIVLDEIDKFDYSDEDPIENARSRQTTYDDSILVSVSTPTDDQAGVSAMFDKADVQHFYMTPCSRCGGFFELFDFSNIRWMGGLSASPEAAAASAHLVCPLCEGRIDLQDHRWMVQHGLWITQGESIVSDGTILGSLDPVRRELVAGWEMLSRLGSEVMREEGHPATGGSGISHRGEEESEDPLRPAPARDTSPAGAGEEQEAHCPLPTAHADDPRGRYGVRIVGTRAFGRRHAYRINENASLVSGDGIPGVVYEFVQHKGNPPATWWQERQGRSPNTVGDRIELTDLRRLCVEPGGPEAYEHGVCPPWTAALLGAIDCQKDCVKVMVRAFGAQAKRSAVVWTEVIARDEAAKFVDVKARLADIGGLPVIGGRRLLTPRFAVDSGAWTHQVYAMVYELQRSQGRDRFILCKGMSTPENNPRQYVRSSIREVEAPSGEKYTLPFDMELLLVNGHLYKDALAQRLMPLPEETVETLRSACSDDAEFEAMLDAIRPIDMPTYASWALADTVLAELTAEEKVFIGKGSGRGGNDGLGRPRRVWRKRMSHLHNDFLDTMVYSECLADRFGVRDWTQAMIDQEVGRVETRLAATAPKGPAPRGERQRPAGSTLAREAARDRIF